MRKIFLSALLLMTGAILEVCAQSIILDNKLQFNEPIDLSGASKPEGWDFENCSLVKNGEKYFVQVNSEGGSVTTSPLVGLLGNARINFLVKPEPLEGSWSFELSVVGKGTLDRSTGSYKSSGWRRGVPFILRNGNADTRIVFSGHNFQICNIVVDDVDDVIYYESFDRCGESDLIVQMNMFDNPVGTESFSNLKTGVGCVFFVDSENSYFSTPSIPSSETGNFIISYKSLVTSKNSNGKIQLLYTDTTGKKHTLSEVVSDKNVWKTNSYFLSDFDSSQGITVQGRIIYFDSFVVREVEALPIDESSTDAALAARWEGNTVFAQLTRTFQKGIWNTCCLPFKMTKELLCETTGDDKLDVELRKLSSITSDGVFYFESTDAVVAGQPFLLKVNKDVVNPVFKNVTIESVTPKTMVFNTDDHRADGYAFKGCFGKTELATDGTNVFLGIDGSFHVPSSTGNVMKGMRAYFVLPSADAARKLAFTDQTAEVTTARPVVDKANDGVLYNMSGQRVLTPLPGIYIKNGKKIIIK